jgi:hypothetical protein
MNDFNKFCAFVKCTLITADVVHYSGKQLRFDVKHHFYRVKNACNMFEKFIHQEIGEMANQEDDINSGICNLVWQIFEMKPEDRERFLEYINKFEYDTGESNGNTGSPVV